LMSVGTHMSSADPKIPLANEVTRLRSEPGSLMVFDMLMSVPKFGRVKAARLLNQCRISQSKTVGGLSDRQRHELIALFNR